MITAIIFVLGLILGSFINALVWRLYKQSRPKAESPKLKVKIKYKRLTSKELSVWQGRSICPRCYHQLSWNDLVPLFSWLALKGKCRYCKQPISPQYPLVELITAALFVISYVYWPFTLNSALSPQPSVLLFSFWLVFLTGLIALAVYDLKHMLLPDKLIKPLFVLALVQAVLLVVFNTNISQLLAIAGAVLIGGGIFYILFQISNGKWIGGGDVKLGALLGLILADAGLVVFTIFSASLLGTLLAVPMLIAGKYKRTTRIPFGPFLIAGAIIARLFGQEIIDWYTTSLLLI